MRDASKSLSLSQAVENRKTGARDFDVLREPVRQIRLPGERQRGVVQAQPVDHPGWIASAVNSRRFGAVNSGAIGGVREQMAVGEHAGDRLAFQESRAGGKAGIDEDIGTKSPDEECIAGLRERTEVLRRLRGCRDRWRDRATFRRAPE